MGRKIPTARPAWIPAAKPLYERTVDRRADIAWYQSKPWRALRAAHLQAHPLCEDCLKQGLFFAAQHVHHLVDRKARPDLALDATNLESLCIRCHNARHRNV